MDKRDLVVVERKVKRSHASDTPIYGQWPYDDVERFAVDRARAEEICDADPTAEILEDEDPDNYTAIA